MKRHSVIVLAVAGLVMFAGCASLISARDNSPETTESPQVTTAQETTESAQTTENSDDDTEETTTEEEEPEPTTTTTTVTTTTEESWSQPEPPNTPLQDNIEEEGVNRIKEIAVGGTGSDEEGYSTVELTIRANSSMPNVDPEEHGDVEGEPFFVIYINGHLVTSDDTNYATPRGFIATRTGEVAYEDDGEFVLRVPKEAFEAAGVEDGSDVELMVLLLDQDKDWDDIYGKQFVNVTYNADA